MSPSRLDHNCTGGTQKGGGGEGKGMEVTGLTRVFNALSLSPELSCDNTVFLRIEV